LSCESQTHLDAYGGRKLFETRELREKHVHESTRVESGDDDPICVTKEGGASGQSKRGYINYCVSSLYNPLVRGQELYLPKYPNTISNTHYARAVGVDTVYPTCRPLDPSPSEATNLAPCARSIILING